MGAFICKLAAGLAVLVAGSSRSLADELKPTGVAVELEHRVNAKVRGDQATLLVERHFVNRGAVATSLLLEVELPTNSVMKKFSLRNDDGSWSNATFVDASRMSSVRPVAKSGVAALVTKMSRQSADVVLFPVQPKQEVAIRYQLETVVAKSDGRLEFVYPVASNGMMPVRLDVDTSAVDSQNTPSKVEVDGKAGSKNQQLGRHVGWVFTSPDRVVTIPLVVPPGMVTANSDTHVTIHASLFEDHDVSVALVSPSGRRQIILASELDSAEGTPINVLPELLEPSESVGEWTLQAVAEQSAGGAVIHRWKFHSAGKTVSSSGLAKSLANVDYNRIVPFSWGQYIKSERRIQIVPTQASPIGTAGIQGRFSSVRIDKNRRLSRFHLDLPNSLSKMPTDLRVVFVLDLSRSRLPRALENDLEIMLEYLLLAPSAKVELITFNRHAKRQFGSFLSATKAAAALQKLQQGQLIRENGSDVTGAALLAQRALSTENGDHRVIIFSDGLMPTAFKTAPLANALKSAVGKLEPIVHIVDSGNENDGRNPRHSLAKIAVKFGGSSESISRIRDEPEFRTDVLGLIRPVRLDFVSVQGPLKDDSDLPTSVLEGQSVRFSSIDRSQGPAVSSIHAKLWQQDVSLRFRSRDQGKLAASVALAARSVRGGPLGTLKPTEKKVLAMLSRVLSSSTALVLGREGIALPPAFRFGSLAGNGISFSCSGPIVLQSISTPTLSDFDEPIEKCTRGRRRAASTFSIETTEQEIVAVKVNSTDHRFKRCLTEALWAHELSSLGKTSATRHSFDLPPFVSSGPLSFGP